MAKYEAKNIWVSVPTHRKVSELKDKLSEKNQRAVTFDETILALLVAYEKTNR